MYHGWTTPTEGSYYFLNKTVFKLWAGKKTKQLYKAPFLLRTKSLLQAPYLFADGQP